MRKAICLMIICCGQLTRSYTAITRLIHKADDWRVVPAYIGLSWCSQLRLPPKRLYDISEMLVLLVCHVIETFQHLLCHLSMLSLPVTALVLDEAPRRVCCLQNDESGVRLQQASDCGRIPWYLRREK
jgi:hypothetical protein